MEAEVRKAFKEEQGLSASGKMQEEEGRRVWKEGEGTSGRKLLPSPVALHRWLLVHLIFTSCWSLRASLLPGTQSSPPQKASPEGQQHPQRPLEAPCPCLP